MVYEEEKKLSHNKVGKSSRKKKELAVEYSGGIITHNHTTRAHGGFSLVSWEVAKRIKT